MQADKRFVKSATTSTAVVNSKSEIEKMLRRYGAEAFSVTHDYAAGKAQVSFLVPDSAEKDARKVPVRLPVDVQRVYHALYGMPMKWNHTAAKKVHDPKGYDSRKMEQAERVAWRNLVLWIDAALSTATISLQTITETFFAHAIIGPQGQTGMQWASEMIDASRQLGSGEAPDAR